MLRDVLILGAGPCGLSTAISLAQLSAQTPTTPLRITLIELRPSLQTIGGAVNLTPLAMRYLDRLGAGTELRKRGIDLDHGIDYVSLRSGQRLGNFWGGIGAVRVARQDLVESLFEVVGREWGGVVEVKWGRRVIAISESDEKVLLRFDDGAEVEGDVLLGCDGLHSAARRLWVEPERQEEYIGRVVAMGWGSRGEQAMTLGNGEAALRDTLLVTNPASSILLLSHYERTRSQVYFANLMPMDEPDGDARDGWKLLGNDKDAVKREVIEGFETGRVKGLQPVIASCEDWTLYPIYVLPPGGRWHRGRVCLVGDAAHAMPPQGESTGIAIEDGVFIARVFERRSSRTVEQLFSDFETVRRDVVDRHYKSAIWGMKMGLRRTGWLTSIIMEWFTWVFLFFKRIRQEDHFADDVHQVSLPAYQ